MTFALPILLTAAGLGAWIVPRSVRVYGLAWYLGFLSIPLALLLLNVTVRLPIALAAWLVVGVAGLGLVRRLSRAPGPDMGDLLIHPIVVLPLAYAVLTAILRPAPYGPSNWGEFSWWLLQPRQILLTGSPAARTLPVSYFARYTPGWPYLMAFPFALVGAPLAPDALRWLPFLSAVGVVATTYDLLRRTVPAFATRPALAWLVVAVVACLGIGLTLTSPNLAIEPPLSHAWMALVVLAVATGRSLAMPRTLVAGAAGILLAGGYVLKEPFIAATPLALCIAAHVSGRRHRLASRVGAWLCVLGPMVLVAALWRAAVHWVKRPPAAMPAVAPTLSGVLAAVAREAGTALAGVQLHHAAIVVLGLVIAVRVASRGSVLAVVTSVGCYVVGLLALYLTGEFARERAGILPEFARYVRVALDPLAYGATVAVATTGALAARRQPWALAVLLVVSAAGLLATLWTGVRQVDGLDALGPARAALVTSARRVRDALPPGEAGPPRLMVLTRDFETGRFLGPMLRYVSLEAGGPPAFLVDGAPVVVQAPTPPAMPFVRSVTPAAFKRRVRRADTIWVLSAEDWVLRILRWAARNPDCVADGVVLQRMTGSRGARSLRCAPAPRG